MTFNRAFKDIFGSELTEKGYKYSAKLGRFVKVKNDELIYSVGYRNIPAIYHNKKCFTITSGIRTVYFDGINKWTFESTERKGNLNQTSLFKRFRWDMGNEFLVSCFSVPVVSPADTVLFSAYAGSSRLYL